MVDSNSNLDVIERICGNNNEDEPDNYLWESDPNRSAIQQFYDGTNVFITGASGFVGMALVEKLLRSCPGIKRLFLLMRPRKGKTPEERATDMFLNHIFEPLLVKYPNILDKVKIIHGDIQQPNLGISSSDAELLKKEVNIVFHVAATVAFDEALRTAYLMNVVSLRSILELAEAMADLKAFVHVSTAFCHVHLDTVKFEEKFYPCQYSEEEVEALLNSADDYTIATLLSHFLAKAPTTYTLTKAIAEDVVRRKMDKLPVAIYRPAIVMNTYEEPIRGWNLTFQGAGALLLGIGLGILRVILVHPEKNADLVPVDKCACALTVLPWYIHTSRRSKDKPDPIYHHVSTPITWKEASEHMIHHIKVNKFASKFQVWVLIAHFETNKMLFHIKAFFYHLLPLPIFALAERLQGQRPRLGKVYRKMVRLVNVLSNFTLENKFFEDKNILRVWSSMSEMDQCIFPLDATKVDWFRYLNFMTPGYGVYVMNETWEDVLRSRIIYRKMEIADTCLHYSIRGLQLFVLYKIGVCLFNMFTNYFEIQMGRLY